MTHDAISPFHAALRTQTSRRQLLAMAAVGTAGAVVAGASTAQAAPKPDKHGYRLTVLGTTDSHGNVFNWDYFKDAEYTDRAQNDVGLAKISTLVTAMRAERGASNCLMLDAGDTIQGTPLAYYYAKIDPITQGHLHPMAAAMNHIGYDAAALGNHEFNYGLDVLRTFEKQLDFPLLGANAVHWGSGKPALHALCHPHCQPPRRQEDQGRHPGPGHSGRGHLGQGQRAGQGGLSWHRRAGGDLCAADEGGRRRPGHRLVPLRRGHLKLVWRRAALSGECEHAAGPAGPGHRRDPGRARPPGDPRTFRDQRADGSAGPALRATEVGHAPHRDGSGPGQGARPVAAGEHARAPAQRQHGARGPQVARLLRGDHQGVRTYVNSPIGTSLAAMSATTAPFEDTAAIDFINHVPADAVSQALVGGASAGLPLLSIAAPFNRDAAIPAGQVTVRDVAGLYIYDNTLLAITLSGAEVKAYLEWSAAYFQQRRTTGPFNPDDVTNAVTATAPNGTPDYNYDIMGGFTARLTYDIDIAQPVGSRIKGLAHDGQPLDAAGQFVVAINNYRQSGGGNFPGVTSAPVVYNAQQEIRQLIIDWVTIKGQINPAEFASVDWQLTANGDRVIIEGATGGGRH